jgi:hypothetical protein
MRNGRLSRPARLAAFWSEALDWKVAYVAEDSAYCRPEQTCSGD